MKIKLLRYFGDKCVTKSRMEVWMDGEDAPRLVCEAREPKFRDYVVSFSGVSHFCLPIGKWKMEVGNSPYGAMGLRVPRCTGHRQVFIGHHWNRQWMEGVILIGESDWDKDYIDVIDNSVRGIKNGEDMYQRLTELVYEAYGKGEEFWMEIDNKDLYRYEEEWQEILHRR